MEVPAFGQPMSAEQAHEIMRLADLAGSSEQMLSQLDTLVAGSEKGQAGVARLGELLAAVKAAGKAPAAAPVRKAAPKASRPAKKSSAKKSAPRKQATKRAAAGRRSVKRASARR